MKDSDKQGRAASACRQFSMHLDSRSIKELEQLIYVIKQKNYREVVERINRLKGIRYNQ